MNNMTLFRLMKKGSADSSEYQQLIEQYRQQADEATERANSLATENAELSKSVGLAISLVERNISEINLPNGLTTIGESAFYQCKQLKGVSIPNTVTTIKSYALAYSGITRIVFPYNVANIYDMICRGCESLTEAIFECQYTIIKGYFFQNCINLMSITFQPNLSEIGTLAISGCTSLETLHLPATLTKIASNAFSGDTNLKNINLEQGFTLQKSLDLKSSKDLTLETAKNLLIALVNYVGKNSEFFYTITFNASIWELLNAEGKTSPDGTTWEEYVETKGWNY